MRECVVALLTVLLASAAHADSAVNISAWWSHLDGKVSIPKYGCKSVPDALVRPAFIAQVTRRQAEAALSPVTITTSVLASPTDGNFAKWKLGFNDVMRIFVRDYAASTHKFRMMFDTRPDVRRPPPLGATDNARTTSGQQGCDSTSNSYSGSGRNCGNPKVPMCVGAGVNEHFWCPFHDGAAVDEATWCPDPEGGSSVCTLVPWDWKWTLTVPRAKHEAAVASFTNLNLNTIGIDGKLCDGTEFTNGDRTCATNPADYPGTGPSRPVGLPTDSIGYALSVAQVAAGGPQWPLANRPVYYVHAMSRGCVGGTNPGTTCTDGDPPPECRGGGTCPADVCSGGSNPKAPCPLGTECRGGGICGGTNTATVFDVGIDLRIEAARWWMAAEFLDFAYHAFRFAGATDAQIQSWPIASTAPFAKGGWWAYYDPIEYRQDTPICTSASDSNTHMWLGPARPGQPWSINCGGVQHGGIVHDTPYGRGEYEAANSDLALKILQQTSDASMCSATSRNPFDACTTNDDCGPASGGTCVAGTNHYFNDVEVYHSVIPNFRSKYAALATIGLRANDRYKGATRTLNHMSPPYSHASDGSGGNENLCTTAPKANAGGPYAMKTSGAGNSVRLVGSCLGAYNVRPAWTFASGTTAGCSFVDPFDLETGATADPQPTLKGCSVANTITVRLTCGGTAKSEADVVVTNP